jgi:hypothetical protein
MAELLARLRAALRHQLAARGERPVFRIDGLSVDLYCGSDETETSFMSWAWVSTLPACSTMMRRKAYSRGVSFTSTSSTFTMRRTRSTESPSIRKTRCSPTPSS